MDFNLDGIGTLSGALDRMEQGKAAYELSRRLGLFTPAHASAEARKPFLDGRRFSELSPDELSDEHSYWRSEAGRLTEILGLLNGQRSLEKLKVKAARARARSRVRARLREEERKASVSEVNDEAEEDTEVIGAEESFAYLEMLYAHAGAAKEATIGYLDGISREITSRGDQLKARVFG